MNKIFTKSGLKFPFETEKSMEMSMAIDNRSVISKSACSCVRIKCDNVVMPDLWCSCDRQTDIQARICI